MTGWQDAEARFARALADPSRPPPRGLTSPRGTPDRLRFAVYRNNVHVSLVEALAKAFPVTLRVVGDPFFRAMARAYVSQNKPESPVLLLYGSSFADFIAGFPPAAGLPYLPDLARLEHAWLQAYHAADAEPLDLSGEPGLTPDDIPGARLVSHPAVRLVVSGHAVGSIWSAHRAEALTALKAGRPEAVLLTRPRADVRATVLPDADLWFARRLLAGGVIGEAAADAVAREPAFDAGRALCGLMALGAFSRILVPSKEVLS